MVQVFEHLAGDRAGVGHDAGVPAAVGFTRVEHGLGGLAVHRVGVAVARVAAHVGRGEAVARRQRGLVELHAVGAGLEAAEQVVAVGVGRERAAHGVAGSIQQGHLDARHAGFARVLLAVAVGVEPNAVAQGGRPVEARVDGRVVLTRGHHDGAGLARAVDVAVARVVALVRQRRHVAHRRHHGHRVGAGGDGEAVVAVGVGGGGRHRVAHRVLQLHGDAGKPQLACVLLAVGVGVFPHAVAQGRRTLVNEVVAGAALARGEGDADHVRVAAVAVAHVGVARLVGLFDGVAAGRHVVEDVVAVHVGGGGRHRVAHRILQHDGHAGDRGVARVVVVQVLTDAAADDARQAFVDEHVAAVGLARLHGDADHVRVAAVAVAHVGVARLVGLLDGVAAGRHVREAVVAVGVGGGGRHHVAQRVLQHHGDARDRRVARAVVVQVFEHLAGDRAGVGHDAGVPAAVGFTRVEHGLGGLAVHRVGVAVARVAAHVGRGEAVARRQRGLVELHAVGAGLEAAEQVVAVGVGRERAAHGVAGSIQQGHLDARHAGFARVLLAVAVGVEPNAVAQGGRPVEARVDGRVVLTRGHHDGAGLARAVDVAVARVVALVRQRRHVAHRRHHGHRVGAGGDGEAVVAVGVGGGGRHRVALGVLQHHGDASDAGFARVLLAVAVGVFPHAVADHGLGREGDCESEGVGGEIQVGATAAVGATVVAHLEVEGEGAASVGRGGIDQPSGGDVGGQDFLACHDRDAAQGQAAAGGHAVHHHGQEVVAFHRIAEAEVTQANHVAVAAGHGDRVVGAGRGVIDRRDVDLQVQHEGVAGAVGAEHADLLDAVEVRQQGHVHCQGVQVHRGEKAAGDLDVLVGGRVEHVELDPRRGRLDVVRIRLPEQVVELVVAAGVFAKGDAG